MECFETKIIKKQIEKQTNLLSDNPVVETCYASELYRFSFGLERPQQP